MESLSLPAVQYSTVLRVWHLSSYWVKENTPKAFTLMLTWAQQFLKVLCLCKDVLLMYSSSTAQGGGGSFKNRKLIGEIGCCESGLVERIHWWTERCLRSPLSLSFSFSDYLPTYLPINLLSIYLSIYLSLSLSSNYLSIYLSIYLSLSFT